MRRIFILTVLCVYPLPQMAIDLYLPSLPAMALPLHASQFGLQLTLGLYLLSLGAGQLFYGPASDRYGRKPALLVGLSIFFFASIGCANAHSIHQLLVYRVLQGLGAGCGFPIASAILGDCFDGKKLARISSIASMIYSLSPIVAPALGGYLQHTVGWRINFYVLAASALILFIAIIFLVQETNHSPNGNALKIKSLLLGYGQFFRHRRFLALMFCLTFSYGISIAFNVLGPFLFQVEFKLTPLAYGQLLLLIGLAYCLGALSNHFWLKFFSMNQILLTACIAVLGISNLLLVSHSVLSIITVTCLAVFATGHVFPNGFAQALAMFPKQLGNASAFLGSGILFATSLLTYTIAHSQANSVLFLAYSFVGISLFLLLSFLLSCRQ